MKCLFSFFCFTILAVTTFAQNPSAPVAQPGVEFGRQRWTETGFPTALCGDCAGLPQAAMDYRWKNRELKYIAFAEVRNTGTKTIESLDLDFVFMDPLSLHEFLRYHVRADVKIKPGRMKEVRAFARDVKTESSNYQPENPSQQVLAKTLSSPLKLMVTRIRYTDGSVWQLPETDSGPRL
jgi:hypothetical protein